MANFKIGQRVKVARITWGNGIEYVGKEGNVSSDLHSYDGNLLPYHGMSVYKVKMDSGRTISAHPEELEPVKYDGNEVVSWNALKKLGLNLDIGELA